MKTSQTFCVEAKMGSASVPASTGAASAPSCPCWAHRACAWLNTGLGGDGGNSLGVPGEESQLNTLLQGAFCSGAGSAFWLPAIPRIRPWAVFLLGLQWERDCSNSPPPAATGSSPRYARWPRGSTVLYGIGIVNVSVLY